jgi:hypothetical protein
MLIVWLDLILQPSLHQAGNELGSVQMWIFVILVHVNYNAVHNFNIIKYLIYLYD